MYVTSLVTLWRIIMATSKQLASCVSVLSGLETAVAETFVQQAHKITAKLTEVFGSANWELEKDDVEAMIDGVTENATWKGTSAERVRKSEYRSIIKGYPFLSAGADYFRENYGTFGKEHLLKIARLGPECETADDAAQFAIDEFTAKDKAKGKGAATQKDKLIAGLKQARKNCIGSRMLADLDDFLKSHKLLKAVAE